MSDYANIIFADEKIPSWVFLMGGPVTIVRIEECEALLEGVNLELNTSEGCSEDKCCNDCADSDCACDDCNDFTEISIIVVTDNGLLGIDFDYDADTEILQTNVTVVDACYMFEMLGIISQFKFKGDFVLPMKTDELGVDMMMDWAMEILMSAPELAPMLKTSSGVSDLMEFLLSFFVQTNSLRWS